MEVAWWRTSLRNKPTRSASKVFLPPLPISLSLGIKSRALAFTKQAIYDVFFLSDKLSLYTDGTVLELPLQTRMASHT